MDRVGVIFGNKDGN